MPTFYIFKYSYSGWLKIKILALSKDGKYISGNEKPLRLQQAESIYDNLPEEQKEGALNFLKMLELIETVDIDIALNDGDIFDWCGGKELIKLV